MYCIESSDSEDSDDGMGINLGNEMTSEKNDDIIFEFNDMREVYNEGMCVLLKQFIPNPTAAFRFADFISKQGKLLIIVMCCIQLY